MIYLTEQAQAEAAKHKAWRECLLADDPALDEQTLADTLEGLTDLTDMLRATVRAALSDEADVDACNELAENLKARMHRLKERAQRRRRSVAAIMQDTGMERLAAPDFTASLRHNQPGLVIVDDAMIPQEFWRMVPTLDKLKLKEALRDGAKIDGAALGNAEMSLTVRTK